MLMPFRATLFAVVLATSSGSALAEPPAPHAAAEIRQLLDRLAVSGCSFQRNGSWHSAGEARAHLLKKYDYLADKGRIGTAEDFIEMAATRSSMSGKPYLVKCGAQLPVHSADWLGARLKEVRAK